MLITSCFYFLGWAPLLLGHALEYCPTPLQLKRIFPLALQSPASCVTVLALIACLALVYITLGLLLA